MKRQKPVPWRTPFRVIRVMVPGARLYRLFTTFVGFLVVFTDEVRSEIQQSKSITVNPERIEGALVRGKREKVDLYRLVEAT